MCCNANKCCCGCVSMKTGITVAGIIDLLILLAAAAAIAVVIGYHGGLLFMIYIANSNYIFVMVVLIAWFGILVTSSTKRKTKNGPQGRAQTGPSKKLKTKKNIAEKRASRQNSASSGHCAW